MSNENRDFIIERLERQLKDKESEIEAIKTTLRESIIREIRSDLKNDLDINNRITKLEQKLQALNNNLNGIMDELLDQKSMIRSLRSNSAPKPSKEQPQPREVPAAEKPEPKVYTPAQAPIPEPDAEPKIPDEPVPQTPVFTAPVRQFVPPEPPISANMADPNVSIRSVREPMGRHSSASGNVNVNIRDVAPAPEPVAPPAPEPKTEYIIAESEDERNVRLNSRQMPRDSCNYIVADDENPRRSQCESEYETVESREDEDAVITVTRRK